MSRHPMDRWQAYLFQNHPESTLRAWAKRLHLFRFCRAYGGHANDGDSLDVAYRYEDFEQVSSFLDALGIKLVVHADRPPQPEPGKSYRGDVFAQFASLIPGTQWIEQPMDCQIAGQKVFAWCGRDQIKLSVRSDYEVTEADVEAAATVEQALLQTSLEREDPPTDNKHCICPKYYPEYFA